MVFAVADQVGAAHGLERFTQQRPVVGIVVAQKGLVQAAALFAAHHIDGLFGILHFAVHPAQRVAAAVVHGGGGGHRAGVKGLHLVGPKAVFFQPDRQMQHVFIGGAGVGGDEVGDQKLLFARLCGELVKQRLELVISCQCRASSSSSTGLIRCARAQF